MKLAAHPVRMGGRHGGTSRARSGDQDASKGSLVHIGLAVVGLIDLTLPAGRGLTVTVRSNVLGKEARIED